MIDVVDPRSVDRAEYLAALNRCFPGWGGDAMFAWCYLRGTADLLILRENGRLVAGSGVVYRNVRTPDETTRVGIICGAWTDPEARGRGLFSDVMEAARVLVGRRDATMLLGFVKADNPSARGIRSLGWTMVPARYLRQPLTRPSATLSPLRGARGHSGGARAEEEKLPFAPRSGEKVREARMRGEFPCTATHFVYTDDEWRAQFIDRPRPGRYVEGEGWRAIVAGQQLLDIEGDRERAFSELGDVSGYSTTSEEWPGFESTPGFLGVIGSNVPTAWDVRNGDRM